MAGDEERHRVFSYLEDRFGIREDLFDGYLLFRGNKRWVLIWDSPWVRSASRLKVLQVGLKAFHRIGAFVKPTTEFIQVFGKSATKAKLSIDRRQLLDLLEGESIPVDSDLETGYVILTLGQDHVLGLGFVKDRKVRSQISKKDLRKVMLTMEGG